MPVQSYTFLFDHQFTHKFESKELAYKFAFEAGHQHLHQVGITFVEQ